MWKSILAAVLGLAVGAVGGMSVMNQSLAPELAKAETEAARIAHEYERYRKETEPKLAQVAMLDEEVAASTEQINELYEEIGQLRLSRDSMTAALVEDELADDALAADETDSSAPEDADDEEEEGRRNRDPEAEAARREAAERFRQGVFDFYDAELQRATDPESQQRILALSEQTAAAMELRQKMRDAATEEEQELLREQHREHLREVDRLMQAQQAQLLRDVADRFKIKGPQRQAFVRSMRRTLESPYFSPFMMYRRWQQREARPQ
jgi:uncharacterized membrane-anchored protein YhcB (DUF1043 family)